MCGLSYLGDVRMGLAEDKNKVQRIVAGSAPGLHALYRGQLEQARDCPWGLEIRAEQQHAPFALCALEHAWPATRPACTRCSAATWSRHARAHGGTCSACGVRQEAWVAGSVPLPHSHVAQKCSGLAAFMRCMWGCKPGKPGILHQSWH